MRATRVAEQLAGRTCAAVWATPTLETCTAVVGGLCAGVPVVPLNPLAGQRELAHILADARPSVILARAADELPRELAALERLDPGSAAGSTATLARVDPERTAIVLYTSGTTGPPKGVEIPGRAVAANLDALADLWEWTADDRLVHALPLFHVHGLVLGLLGPLRRGGSLELVPRFDAAAVAAAATRDGTMLFGVPTMYRRIADAAESDAHVGRALGRLRILVSGSAALPVREHRRVAHLTGQNIVERYGLTETLINTASRLGMRRCPATSAVRLPESRSASSTTTGAPSTSPTTRRSVKSSCAGRTSSRATSTGRSRHPSAR